MKFRATVEIYFEGIILDASQHAKTIEALLEPLRKRYETGPLDIQERRGPRKDKSAKAKRK